MDLLDLHQIHLMNSMVGMPMLDRMDQPLVMEQLIPKDQQSLQVEVVVETREHPMDQLEHQMDLLQVLGHQMDLPQLLEHHHRHHPMD